MTLVTNSHLSMNENYTAESYRERMHSFDVSLMLYGMSTDSGTEKDFCLIFRQKGITRVE